MKKNFNQLIYYCGIFSPIVFITTFSFLGFFRENFSATQNFISELSIGKNSWIQISNFMFFGLIFFLFSLKLLSEFKKRKLSKSGPILFLIIAFCLFFSGPFVTDPGTIFTNQKSTHGLIHGILGGIVFLLMPISAWVNLQSYKKEKDFISLKNISLLIAIILSVSLLVFIYATKVPDSVLFLRNKTGLLQRLVLIPFMLWISYLSFRLKSILHS